MRIVLNYQRDMSGVQNKRRGFRQEHVLVQNAVHLKPEQVNVEVPYESRFEQDMRVGISHRHRDVVPNQT